MRVHKSVFVIILILLAAWLPAQSLLDDPGYRALTNRVEELRLQAQQAVEDGRYDDAVTLTEEAEEVRAEAEAYAEARVLAFRANSWLVVARNRVSYAESIGADERYAAAYNQATESLASAETSFERAEYESAINSAKLVLSSLASIQPPVAAAAPEPVPEPQAAAEPEPEPEPVVEPAEPEPAVEPAEPVLPRYYVVRLIPERRDCFWRIAEYDFVYGDPWQWRVLYEANREKIPDPENPDLILPGIVLEIPSLAGEERAGTWEPPGTE